LRNKKVYHFLRFQVRTTKASARVWGLGISQVFSYRDAPILPEFQQALKGQKLTKGGLKNNMNSNQTQCCCGGNVNQFEKLDEILKKYQGIKGALIPVLQDTQHAYGYLPREVIQNIAEKINIPVSQIYGVVTFYAQFHLKPRGKNIIRVCQGTACHVRGGKAILAAIEDILKIKAGGTTPDLMFTLETVACIGACGLAPVLMINDDTHGRLTPETTAEILAKYTEVV